MAAKQYPTQQEARKRLRYEPETGLLFWLPKEGDSKEVRNFNTCHAGKEAGRKSAAPGAAGGHVRSVGMSVNGKRYALSAHRLVWIVEHGPIPPGLVLDHINGDPCDNRLDNLRLATHTQNMYNRKPHKNSRSKVLGVGRKHRRWKASITVAGKYMWLGTYKTLHEAAAARRAAEIKYLGEFAPCLSRVGP